MWAAIPVHRAAADDPEFTSEFRLGDCHWRSTSDNPYFPLKPGSFTLLENGDEEEPASVLISVLREKRTIQMQIDGKQRRIRTRVVEERESENGELVEVSRNFFAECKETRDVFYFGEDVDIYEDGEIVSHDGAWLAGRDGAMPGIIMPGTYLIGARYFQEVAPGVALDRSEHVGMGNTIETEAGVFDDCVETLDSSALGGDEDTKFYCPGIGITIDEDLELVDFGRTGHGHGWWKSGH